MTPTISGSSNTKESLTLRQARKYLLGVALLPPFILFNKYFFHLEANLQNPIIFAVFVIALIPRFTKRAPQQYLLHIFVVWLVSIGITVSFSCLLQATGIITDCC